jgi:hypothetical protein
LLALEMIGCARGNASPASTCQRSTPG